MCDTSLEGGGGQEGEWRWAWTRSQSSSLRTLLPFPHPPFLPTAKPRLPPYAPAAHACPTALPRHRVLDAYFSLLGMNIPSRDRVRQVMNGRVGVADGADDCSLDYGRQHAAFWMNRWQNVVGHFARGCTLTALPDICLPRRSRRRRERVRSFFSILGGRGGPHTYRKDMGVTLSARGQTQRAGGQASRRAKRNVKQKRKRRQTCTESRPTTNAINAYLRSGQTDMGRDCLTERRADHRQLRVMWRNNSFNRHKGKHNRVNIWTAPRRPRCCGGCGEHSGTWAPGGGSRLLALTMQASGLGRVRSTQA